MSGGLLGFLITLLVMLIIAWLLTTRLLRHGRRRARRATLRALKDFRVKLNRSKLSPKHQIRDLLMSDKEVIDAIVAHAAETGGKLGDAERRAEEYVDEIVPSFNLFSYYVIGHAIAGLATKALYQLEVQPNPNLDDDFHQKNAVIYVANHRSNADYVLLSYVLTRTVSISYAVGEWARVWPLESLFKSFGSYFIRRGYREALYHTVLRRYVQLVTKQGVTQGVFIEGGLSRDGRLRPPKVGMLDNLTGVLREEGFDREDIVFVPVGLNYDRVLEDRPLTNEHLRRRHVEYLETEARIEIEAGDLPGEVQEDDVEAVTSLQPKKRGGRLWARRRRMLKRVLGILFKNLMKYRRSHLRKHGRVAVVLGEPVSFKDWVAASSPEIHTLERKARLGEVARFAEHLLGRIGDVVPGTPVTVFARALVEHGFEDRVIEVEELRPAVVGVLAKLGERGAPLLPADMDADFVLTRGRRLLGMRGVIDDDEAEHRLRVPADEGIILRYYALSLDQYFRPPPSPEAPSGAKDEAEAGPAAERDRSDKPESDKAESDKAGDAKAESGEAGGVPGLSDGRPGDHKGRPYKGLARSTTDDESAGDDDDKTGDDTKAGDDAKSEGDENDDARAGDDAKSEGDENDDAKAEGDENADTKADAASEDAKADVASEDAKADVASDEAEAKGAS